MRGLPLALLVAFALLPTCVAKDVVLLDASDRSLIDGLNAQSAKLEQKNTTTAGALLTIKTEAGGQWPGFNMGKRDWSLAYCDYLVIDVYNHDDQPIMLNCRLDSPDFDTRTMNGTYTQSFEVKPQTRGQHRIVLPPPIPQQLQEKFFGMRGAPGGGVVSSDPQAVRFCRDTVIGLTLFLNNPERETSWSVISIVASSDRKTELPDWHRLPPEQFFPMIDTFGQFKHEHWRDKVSSEDELRKNITLEAGDLAEHPGPAHRNQYGGYTAPTAPKLQATGHFRVETVDGRWWFIDPEGCLFWSHGVNCVTANNGTTPITDREFYFADLPAREDARFRECYGQGTWAPHNYYEGRGVYQTFNFTQSNLIRKYGDDWFRIFSDLTHKRLRSWGMNTIANWSDAQIYRQRKTPYTTTLNSGGRVIEGSSGYWGKFPDPYSQEFTDALTRNVARVAPTTANDPWCLGYFVDNEISWGEERSLAIAAAMSPPDQPAKTVFLEELKKKYTEVGKLNEAWGTQFSDWEDFLNSQERPNERRAKADLDLFHRLICERYFEVILNILKKAAPEKLYLGCRFAWANEPAIRAAEKYCDVVSFNIYNRTLADFKLPEGMDKPVVIGEFHFGALDRGMFHTGLVPTKSQEERAQAYERYVRSGLEHPQIIGTHWFQYGDQATTGRGDGENYQIGLLNIVDTPYAETIEALRTVGYQLYEIRLQKENAE
jgi:hypothetical protein